ncbi:serine-enriched protein [Trichonephila clavipes]|nr:serine-enriched protein [Trichonephila clavipes]
MHINNRKLDKYLGNIVLEFVDSHGNDVLSLGSFALLPEHVVRLILSREELQADELTKFQAAAHWSRRFCDAEPGADLREVMSNFLECIEFYKIPAGVLMREASSNASIAALFQHGIEKSTLRRKRRYPHAENRVWSDQEDHEERGSTISRHLAEANLKSKRPFRVLPLTPEHRQLRLQWCQAISKWNVTDWQKVVFSDESRFVLGTDDNRVRVWRHPDERTFPKWSPRDNFQQDNARPHSARVAQDFLRHFQTLPWPARSPDLSPVEHVHPVGVVPDHVIMNALAYQADPSSVDFRKVGSPNRFRRMSLMTLPSQEASSLLTEKVAPIPEGSTTTESSTPESEKKATTSRFSKSTRIKLYRRSKTLAES